MKKLLIGFVFLLACLLIGEIVFNATGNGSLTRNLYGKFANEPNEILPPRKIVMPTKEPMRTCPIHGPTDVLLTIEMDDGKYTYCKKCVFQYVIKLLDQNIPELENEDSAIKTKADE